MELRMSRKVADMAQEQPGPTLLGRPGAEVFFRLQRGGAQGVATIWMPFMPTLLPAPPNFSVKLLAVRPGKRT